MISEYKRPSLERSKGLMKNLKISVSIHTRQLLVVIRKNPHVLRQAGLLAHGSVIGAAFPISQWHSGSYFPYTVTSSHRHLTCFPIIRLPKPAPVVLFIFLAYYITLKKGLLPLTTTVVLCRFLNISK